MPPFPPANLAAWLFACVLYGVVYYFQGIRKDAAWVLATNLDVRATIIEAFFVSTLAAVLLSVSLQKYYLTWESRRGPVLAAWCLLALGYPLISGWLLVLTRNDITFVGPFNQQVQWGLTAQTVLFGQYAALAAVAMSLLWTADDPALGSIRNARRVALGVLRNIKRTQAVSKDDYHALKDSVLLLDGEGGKATGRVLNRRDASALRTWIAAAHTTHEEYLKSRDAGDMTPSDPQLTQLRNALTTNR